VGYAVHTQLVQWQAHLFLITPDRSIAKYPAAMPHLKKTTISRSAL